MEKEECNFNDIFFYDKIKNMRLREVNMEIASIIIPSVISIIGFGISIYVIGRELHNGIRLKQNEYILNKMSDVMEAIEYANKEVLEGAENKGELSDLIENFSNKIQLYGSYDAMKIIEKMKTTAYSGEDVGVTYSFYLFVLLSLLKSQIKKDMTGIIVPPDVFMKIRANDYKKHEDKIKEIVNSTIEELKLSKKFKI